MKSSCYQTLQEALVVRHQVAREEVRWHLYCRVFPLQTRLWRNFWLLMGADPFDAEYAFVTDLSHARSTADVENAFLAHLRHPRRKNRLLAFLLGTRPEKRRVLEYFHAVMSAGQGPSASGVVEKVVQIP